MTARRIGRTALVGGLVRTLHEPEPLRDHVVLIEDDRITAITPRTVTDLSGAKVIDVADKWIAPALADAHVHLHEPGDVALYLASSVTLVRNMWGKPWHLLWQSRVESRDEVGPTVVTTSPIADGIGPRGTTVWPGSAVVRSRDEALLAVAVWADAGYQQIKAYSWLSPEALRGLGEACADRNLRLVGHCPEAMSFAEAISAGQSCFEHMTNIEFGVLELQAEAEFERLLAAGESRYSAPVQEQLKRIDWTRMADLVGQMADQHIFNCPTLVVLEQPYKEVTGDDPRMGCIGPHSQHVWLATDRSRRAAASPEQRRDALDKLRRRNHRIVAMLAEAGVPLLAGSDAHNPFVFPGSALVEELELLVEAGIPPARAVRMATVENSRFLGFHDRGVLVAGARAELVVLDGDPTVSVSAYRSPSWVITNGTLLDRASIDAMLDDRRAEVLEHAAGRARMMPGSLAEQETEFSRTRLDIPDGRTGARCRSHSGGGREILEESVTVDGRGFSRIVTDSLGWLQRADIVHRGRFGTQTAQVTRSAEGDRYEVGVQTLDGMQLRHHVEAPLLPASDLGAVASAYAVKDCTEHDPSVLSLSQTFGSHALPEVRAATRVVTDTGIELTEFSPAGNVRHEMQFVDGRLRQLTTRLGIDSIVLTAADDQPDDVVHRLPAG